MLQENASLKELIDTFQEIDNEIVNRGGSRTVVPSVTNQVLDKGYYTGDITVNGDFNLKPENIKKGVSIFSVEGTCEHLFPEGWKDYKEGTVICENIEKNDAIVYNEYSDLGNDLTEITNFTISLNGKYDYINSTPDGNYLFVVYGDKTLAIYKNNNYNFTKLPNPRSLTSKIEEIVSISYDSSCIIFKTTDSKRCEMYTINKETDTFTKVPLPQENDKTYVYSLNEDGSVLARCDNGIVEVFNRDINTNRYTLKSTYKDNTTFGHVRLNPAGNMFLLQRGGGVYCVNANNTSEYKHVFSFSNSSYYEKGHYVGNSWINNNSFLIIERGCYVYTFKKRDYEFDFNKREYKTDPDISPSYAAGVEYYYILKGGRYLVLNFQRATSSKIYYLAIIKIENGNYINLRKFNRIPFENYQANLAANSKFILISNRNGDINMYKTSYKKIVTSLNKRDDKLPSKNQIGIALESKRLSESIKVNVFDKL